MIDGEALLLASFHEFFGAFWSHWVWLMTGGPFLLERILKQHVPSYEPWAKRYISPAIRLTAGVSLAVFGVFFAGFLTYDDERKRLIEAQQIIASSKSPSIIPRDLLSASDLSRLDIALRALPPARTFVSFAVTDPSCARVAEQLFRALKVIYPTGNVSIISGWIESDEDYGMQMVVRNHEHMNDRQLAYLRAFTDSGINLQPVEMPADPSWDSVDFSVFIGPKKISF